MQGESGGEWEEVGSVIQCDTMTVSGVTHRSYFQRDLISTVVTFGHPETGYYITPLLIPTSLRLHLILNPVFPNFVSST